jgi:hypothetical protein
MAYPAHGDESPGVVSYLSSIGDEKQKFSAKAFTKINCLILPKKKNYNLTYR